MVGLGVAAVIPPEGDRRQAVAGGKLKADGGFERVAFLVHGRGGGLDLRRIAQLQRAEGHVGGVAGHVAERAGAEVLPAAPDEGMIHRAAATSAAAGGLVGPLGFVRAHGRRADPPVPIQRRGDRVRAGRPIHALRPDGPVGPHIDLPHRPDEAGLNDLDRAAQAVFGAALIAHLGGDLVLLGELAEQPRFIDRVRQGLLAIDMFAHAHGGGGGDGVHVIRRGHDDRIQRLLLVEHLAEVLVELGVGILLAA